MRRSRVFVLVSALILSIATYSAASAEPPGSTPVTGALSARPSVPFNGEPALLFANFSSGSFTVTFYKQNGASWDIIGTDPSNSSGNAYLNHTPTGTETVYARITGSSRVGITQELTITPQPISPIGNETGTITTSPSTFGQSDVVTVGANFPNGARPVSLYKKETAADAWALVGTKQSNSSGDASFTNFAITGAQQVFARTNLGDRTNVRELKPSPKVTLTIRRDCSGNDCSGTATATGTTIPADEGRLFRLQYKSGSSWVSVGSPAATGTTGADGKVEIQFNLSGIPTWSARSYRLFAAADASDPQLTSNTRSFMPGPTTLGKNVLRVDVANGVFPTSKGPEYAAKATASTNGTPFLTDVAVEDFGVRGTSTAGYTKKPYKLKFEVSPKPTEVFGMEPDRSWTLLASYLDQSYVRDKVGLDLGRRLNAHDDGVVGEEDNRWTPDSEFVELFVNDQYRGSYLMTESVKIDGDRVDISSKQGMIMEVDNALSSAIDFLSSRAIVFAFKDPDERKTGAEVEEGVTDAKVSAVKNRINAFEAKLYSSSGRDEYEDFIDEEAAVDYNLIKEFTKDNDADFNSSHYFSWDQKIDNTAPLNPLQDNKFHFGPVWDFDRSAGNVDPDSAGHTYMSSPNGWVLRGTGTPSDSGRQLYRTHWFVQLFKDPGFKNAVEARWLEVRDEFEKVGDSEVAALKAELGVGASNDRERWKNEPKRYRAAAGTFSFVTQWYKDRYDWMDGQLT